MVFYSFFHCVTFKTICCIIPVNRYNVVSFAAVYWVERSCLTTLITAANRKKHEGFMNLQKHNSRDPRVAKVVRNNCDNFRDRTPLSN